MKVIDSSLWIEFFIGTGCGSKFIQLLENEEDIIVPTIVITEVYKKFLNDSTIEIATAILRKLSTFQSISLDLKLSALSSTLGKNTNSLLLIQSFTLLQLIIMLLYIH